MIPIQCVSAGCYWSTAPGAEVEDAAASLVVHWRAKHEPRPAEIPSDLVPIDGTFTSHEQQQAPPAVKKPTRPSVTVIRRNLLDRGEPETDDRGLTSGGVPPETVWNRPDPYPKERRAKMTRKLPMGRPFR